ncbi:MAG: polysaccharide export protein [Methylobacterium sp.]|nr:polysaccharide export protein [Methylobacterium sp.]MCA3628091.1 polysaccharide export protein [Methylobacterium sp.]
MRIGTFGSVVAAGLALAGCAALPSTGPTTMEVSEQANVGAEVRFVLRDVDDHVVSVLASSRPPTFHGSFGDSRPAPSQRIGIGDTVQVTIWEAAAGGLFSSPAIDRNSTGARSAVIPPQIVAKDGSITVPYAGRIRVAGLTTPEVELRIVAGLTGKAIEPQVLVTVPLGLSNAVTVLGEGTNGARVPLSVRGERILDVLASAGGIRAPAHETFVTLQRRGRTAAVPMQRLVLNASENIYAHPDDVITVVRDPQTYSVFGAAGRNAVVPFDAADMTLEQAVAKAGGLLDWRSDPQGVFLLRYETAAVARQLDPTIKVAPPDAKVPVIYKINLRDAKSYFLAQNIQIRNRDMLYVANSPATEIQKVLGLLLSAAQPVTTGAAIATAF